MLEVKNLCASYPRKKLFDNINFTLDDGSFCVLCGKNGSGKSTLLSLIAGVIPNSLCVSGEILLDGKNVFKLKRKSASKKISLLLQNESPAWNFTVKEFIQTGLYSQNLKPSKETDLLINKTLSLLNINYLKEKHIYDISGGEFQKCRLARNLIQQSKYMLFDEPSENLDLPFQSYLLKTIKSFTNIIKEEQKTVLLSIHDINLASIFTEQFLLISEHKIIKGSHKNIFNKDVLDTAFSANCKIYTHPELNIPQVLFI